MVQTGDDHLSEGFMSCKVSIIVPTFNTPPERLEKLLHSVDAQTMPGSEYELIFVDDGSTTDISATLKNLESERANVRFKRIPNSGWPCRPRNVGLDMANGEYVLFMDHDDVLFPEGLDRTYAFAKSSDADIVNPKEVRTKGWSWGWTHFNANRANAHNEGIASLLPMTPHKFYRRAFLLENDIAYIEKSRVLWEDVYFNVLAFSMGARVAVYADYPLYHWVRTGTNTSTSFERDQADRWSQVQRLIKYITQTLPEGSDRDYLLTHWFKSRVLAFITHSLFSKSEKRINLTLDYAYETATTLIPQRLDRELSPVQHAKATALRNNDRGTLRKLAAIEHDRHVRTHISQIRWCGSRLELSGSTAVRYSDGTPVSFHWESGSLRRDDLTDVVEKLGADELDFSGLIEQGTYDLSLKARTTRETWRVDSESSIDLDQDADKTVNVVGRIRAAIDVEASPNGMPLTSQPWDIGARFAPLDRVFHSGVLVDRSQGFSSGALVNGRSVVAYKNQSDLLTIDIGGHVRHVLSTAGLDAAVPRVDFRRGKCGLTIPLPELHTHGETRISGTVYLTPVAGRTARSTSRSADAIAASAVLSGDASGARITIEPVDLPRIRYRITTEFDDHRQKTALTVDLARSGIRARIRSAGRRILRGAFQSRKSQEKSR